MLALLVTLQSLLRPPPPRSRGLAMRGGGIDIGRALLDAALSSPLYKAVLVPQAQRTMVETAERNGVPWRDALDWIKARGPWRLSEDDSAVAIPEYYRRPFHAYEQGNLCWDAAWEGEIASRAVGARNFPEFGERGEEAFRGAFDEALASLGAECPAGGSLVDLGCGSGISTRRLAAAHPQAGSVVGVDLSPHFLAVGRMLLELEEEERRRWVQPLEPDGRISLLHADAAATGLAACSVDVVQLSLVMHELPPAAAGDIFAEAHRILRPGGQLWVTEMDFATEGFSKLRSNPLLFSLIRSTEPYLDAYADWQTAEGVPGGGPAAALAEVGFGRIRLAAATGRHFALVCSRPLNGCEPDRAVDDRRAATAKPDTHLKTWEAKAAAGARAPPPTMTGAEGDEGRGEEEEEEDYDEDGIGMMNRPSRKIAQLKAEMAEAEASGDLDRIMTLMGTLLALEGGYEGEGGGRGAAHPEGRCAD
mmetsp:Transcript_38279/g.114599  ORF Transcript_38279/g.114599 Transcript_38279/m.114599 type:complete len:477 (+) Transcript_38279:60-1490(+)